MSNSFTECILRLLSWWDLPEIDEFRMLCLLYHHSTSVVVVVSPTWIWLSFSCPYGFLMIEDLPRVQWADTYSYLDSLLANWIVITKHMKRRRLFWC